MWILLLLLITTAAQPAVAQDQPEHDWGGFRTQGSATVGYRFDDIAGRREKFLELFDLQSGPRLLDFTFSGAAKEGAAPFADHFQFTASGLGGDPFPSGQLTVSKSKVYDLRVNYRQSYYYWDRNDNVVLSGGLPGLTSNHNWATVRRFGSINLLLHATNRLTFRVEYGRNSRDGMNDTTRTLDYFGSGSNAAWGAFLRDNPYYVEAPIRELSNRVAGGFDYTLDHWSFHYTAGYQSFSQALNWNNAASPEISINIGSPNPPREPLSLSSWSESRDLTTPSSEFSYNGTVTRWLTTRGDFLYFRYAGPANMDAAFAGIARTTSAGAPFGPYTVSLGSRAQLSEPNYVVDQGFSFKLTPWSNLHLDYRYNQFTEHNSALEQSNFNGTPFSQEAVTDWKESLQQLDLNLEVLPTAGLVIRPGVRLVKRDTIDLEDRVANPLATRRTKTVWPIASVAYLPSRKFSVRADFQEITNGTSYTRITPHTDTGGRIIARYRPWSKLSIENNLVIRNRRLVASDFRNNIRSNAATISWAWSDKFSTFAGFSYDSFLARASVTFLRGTPPLNTSWRDQTVNRVWQAGVSAQPLPRFGFMFSGNFVRDTGTGEISGERPNSGPLTFPMATASIHYDVPSIGRFTVDLQRTYYFEEIIRGNDFQANLLTVRWSRPF